MLTSKTAHTPFHSLPTPPAARPSTAAPSLPFPVYGSLVSPFARDRSPEARHVLSPRDHSPRDRPMSGPLHGGVPPFSHIGRQQQYPYPQGQPQPQQSPLPPQQQQPPQQSHPAPPQQQQQHQQQQQQPPYHHHHHHHQSSSSSRPPESHSRDASLHSRPLTAGPSGPLPPPPHRWEGYEECMRSWLAARSEEEKRCQEEEKRRQEEHRFRQEEQRTRQAEIGLERTRLACDMVTRLLESGTSQAAIPAIIASLTASNEPPPPAVMQMLQESQSTTRPSSQAVVPHDQMSHRREPTYPHSSLPTTPGSATVPSTRHAGSPRALEGHTPRHPPAGPPPSAQHGMAPPQQQQQQPLIQQPPQQTPHQQPQQPQQPPPQHSSRLPPSAQDPQAQLVVHQWQPPASSPASAPSGPENSRKRKAAGQPGESPRVRPSTFMNHQSCPAGGRKRGHTRQESDLSGYSSPGMPNYRIERRAVSPEGGLGINVHARSALPSPAAAYRAPDETRVQQTPVAAVKRESV